jgi:hypothetical protein
MPKDAFKMKKCLIYYLGNMISELKEDNLINWKRVQINGIIKNRTQMSVVNKVKFT